MSDVDANCRVEQPLLDLNSKLGRGERKRSPLLSFVVEVPGIEPGSVQASSVLLRV